MGSTLKNPRDLFSQEVLDTVDPNNLKDAFDSVNRLLSSEFAPGIGNPILGVLLLKQSGIDQLLPIWQEINRLRLRQVYRALQSDEVMKELGFTTDEIQLIVKDPFLTIGNLSEEGWIAGLPIIGSSRIDWVLGKYGWFSPETNTGEPGGLVFKDLAHDGLSNTALLGTLMSEGYKRYHLKRKFLDAAITYFCKFRESKPETPASIAVVDVTESPELRIMTAALRRQYPGYQILSGTWNNRANWKYLGGSLMLEGVQIGMIVRLSPVDLDVMGQNDHPVVQAFLAGDVLSFPTISARLGGAKAVDRNIVSAWDSDRFGPCPIPFTKTLSEDNFEAALANRATLVLKASLGGGSKDSMHLSADIPVTFGKKVSQSEWRRLLRKALLCQVEKPRRYVLQHLAEQDVMPLLSVQAIDDVSMLVRAQVQFGVDPYFVGTANGPMLTGFAVRGKVFTNGWTGEPCTNNVMKGESVVGLALTKD